VTFIRSWTVCFIFSYAWPTEDRVRGGRCRGWRLGAQAHHLGHQRLIRLLLRGLGNEVIWFCSPTATKIDGGKLTTVRQLGRTLATVSMSSSGAPAPRMASMVKEPTSGPHPSRNSTRDVVEKRGDDGGSALFMRWGKLPRGTPQIPL
jgi:hypothetical protein